MTKAIHQFLPNFSYGDAIGYDTLHLRKILQELGYESNIYAGVIHPYLLNDAESYKKYVSDPDNVIIYHFSVGSELTEYLMHIPERVIVIFHNITPYRWFSGVNPHLWELSVKGEDELGSMAQRATAAWGDSQFNCSILQQLGYQNTAVLPIVVNLERFNTPPNPLVAAMLTEETGPHFLFVGRITPNKCHEDIIRIVAYYQRCIDLRARLTFVGEYYCCQKYYFSLQEFIKQLRVSHVTFTGMIDFDELIAHYQRADIFLCMSEHEGFCVPVLEAFTMNVPVVAYNVTAVPETMDGAGVLVNSKSPAIAAELCHHLITDSFARERIIQGQRARIERYNALNFREEVKRLLKGVLE